MCRPKWREYWPGCRPAPAEAGAEATAKAATEVGGAVWAGRTPRKPIHGGSMAPCSCAPSCAHGKTGVGRPAHTAPPLTVSRHLVDPRRAWMDVHTVSKSMNGLDVIRAWLGSTCRPRSTPTNSSRNLSKAGWVRLRGRERHGWRDRAYRDVLAASPATGPTPPSHGMQLLLLLLLLPLRLRVPGAARPQHLQPAADGPCVPTNRIGRRSARVSRSSGCGRSMA